MIVGITNWAEIASIWKTRWTIFNKTLASIWIDIIILVNISINNSFIWATSWWRIRRGICSSITTRCRWRWRRYIRSSITSGNRCRWRWRRYIRSSITSGNRCRWRWRRYIWILFYSASFSFICFTSWGIWFITNRIRFIVTIGFIWIFTISIINNTCIIGTIFIEHTDENISLFFIFQYIIIHTFCAIENFYTVYYLISCFGTILSLIVESHTVTSISHLVIYFHRHISFISSIIVFEIIIIIHIKIKIVRIIIGKEFIIFIAENVITFRTRIRRIFCCS